MGKVYIGVMALGGHKLWGAGRERAGGGVKTPPYDVEG